MFVGVATRTIHPMSPALPFSSHRYTAHATTRLAIRPRSPFPATPVMRTMAAKPYDRPVTKPISTLFTGFFTGPLFARSSPSLQHRQISSISVVPPRDNKIEQMVHALTPLQKKCLERMSMGAMSFGAIGFEPHITLAEAANRIALAIHGGQIGDVADLPVAAGPKSNSGEGGELPIRNNTIYQSRIRQIASARFGVNLEYLAFASELQIKIQQGAKPGLGGELPEEKVTVEIAATRLTQPGTRLVSPAPHHDIYSVEDLKQLRNDLRSVNPKALISVKLAAGPNVGIIAAAVAKSGADKIVIVGPGGTGAAPLTAKFEFAHPVESALAEIHQTLIQEGLRESVKLVAGGGMQTGLDHVKMLFLGADEIEGGTNMLVAMGCVNAEKCEKNTCPTGIATTDKALIKAKFKGKPEDVARLMIHNAKTMARILRRYGFSDPAQAVGRCDLLQLRPTSPLTGLEKLLAIPTNPYSAFGKIPKTAGSSYRELSVITAIREGERQFLIPASSRDLSFGARIGYFSVTDPDFAKQLPGTIIEFTGLAPGQSFGFAAPKGLTLIANNSNDGTGKSLDGAHLFIRNMGGNQTGYGATAGLLALRATGDRAFVRNSGVVGMVERIGELGLSFMTGGRVTILGTSTYYPPLYQRELSPQRVNFREDVVGPNLGAGMTGGSVVMPRALYIELRDRHYLSANLTLLKPQALNAVEKMKFWETLVEYNRHIQSELSQALIELGVEAVTAQMVKLSPVVSSLVSSTTEPTSPAYPEEFQTSVKLKNSQAVSPLEQIQAQPSTGPKIEKDACGTGVLMNRKGEATHQLVTLGLKLLANMQHRGATGIDPKTGDGCGVTWYGLHGFFAHLFPRLEKGQYGIIHLALPKEAKRAEPAIALLRSELQRCGLELSDGRQVPINNNYLGHMGLKAEPDFMQYVVLKPKELTQEQLEGLLVRVRLRFELTLQAEQNTHDRPHIISASAYQVIYKALVREEFLGNYFEDFTDPAFEASAVVAHARFSTNTRPNFRNIQPLPRVANNGENNSLELLARTLKEQPQLQELLGLEKINLDSYSDSNIMSLYMDMLHLLGFDAEDMALATIQGAPSSKYAQAGRFYRLTMPPFEGPNASIIPSYTTIVVKRDKHGLRPQRGVISDDLVYSASELALDIPGDVFDLPPAAPLVLDLKSGSVSLYEIPPERNAFFKDQLQQLKRLPATISTKGPMPMTQEELRIRKLRAGWDDEVHQNIMLALFRSLKELTRSMGDKGPIEALVRGSYFNILFALKGNFSQVTNPPLAKNEEKNYMSTETLLGPKVAIADIHRKTTHGYLLDSPVLTNEQLEVIKKDSSMQVQVVDINYPLGEYETGIRKRMEQILAECVASVVKGANLIILSDLHSSDTHAPIPPLFISSALDRKLNELGWRHKVRIVMQTGQAFTGTHIAQLVSVGGVDAVNPYLVFIYDETENVSVTEFTIRRMTYLNNIREELLSFMGRMGISSLSAYRGTKGFNSYGFDKEILEILGIQGQFGGISMQDVSRINLTNHRMPTEVGHGKYAWNGQESRTPFWDPGFTQATIKYARGQLSEAEFEASETVVNRLKRGQPRGWLSLKQSKKWTEENRLPVCILGGGASAFYQAQALLDSGLPVRIILIEQHVGNKFGLLLGGVAPDHEGTRNQAKLFRGVIEDPRVSYYGGVEVDNELPLSELEMNYPCIIDCRGAAVDRCLNVPGEESVGVVQAREVYRIYNSEFSPFRKLKWPFTLKSKNPILGIIGNGNVAADLARIFLKDPADLAKTSINPIFLEFLRLEGPSAVRIFARSGPQDTKIGIKELNELVRIGISFCAYFDDSTIDTSKFNAHQKELYEFFVKVKNKPYSSKTPKIIYFHFQMKPTLFKQIESEVEAVFENPKGKKETFRTSNYVVAIGRTPLEQANKTHYQSGWITGEGGSLKSAQESVQRTTEQIQRDFYSDAFVPRGPIAAQQPWMLKSSVGNREFRSILDWIEAGHPLRTVEDFRQARHFRPAPSATTKTSEAPAQSAVASPQPTLVSNSVTVIDASTQEERHVPATSGTETILGMLKNANMAPKHECDGAITCGTCVAEVVRPPKEGVRRTPKEAAVLRANDVKSENAILTCAHPAQEYAGSALRVKKE